MRETLQTHTGPNWLVQRQHPLSASSGPEVDDCTRPGGARAVPQILCAKVTLLFVLLKGPALIMSPPPWAWLQGSEGQLLL